MCVSVSKEICECTQFEYVPMCDGSAYTRCKKVEYPVFGDGDAYFLRVRDSIAPQYLLRGLFDGPAWSVAHAI